MFSVRGHTQLQRLAQGCPAVCPQCCSRTRPHSPAMSKHMTADDLDTIFKWKGEGVEPVDVHKRLCALRRQQRRPEPDVTTVRRALGSKTFKRGREETRGRKTILSNRNMEAMDAKREELIQKADSEWEVTWDDVVMKSRVPAVHRTTAAKNMSDAGYDVKFRRPREKPVRGEIDEAQRKRICNKLRKLPHSYFQRKVHIYIDNKVWEVPTTAKGNKYMRMRKVRGHLRKRSEGLKKGYTKPSVKRHRVNTGGRVNVCAGIIGGKVRVWHYLPRRWCGAVAEDVYRNVVAPALRKHCGHKRKYTILEDNDPTGYKSGKAITAKAELGSEPIEFPTYSPDLNPLDFALWSEIEARMTKNQPKHETHARYKARLWLYQSQS